ncbi:alpha/beta fold hydrolase [Actinomadura keratinilytica]
MTPPPPASGPAPHPDLTDLPGFTSQRVAVDDGVWLDVAVGGSGTPVVLLHGFPQTRLMWRHVAADLAATGHTVICPDLRGYGASDKPAETCPEVYAKRAMARDIVRLAAALGHDRFALAGHDRGALVAFRAALDHPEAVTRVALLDILPTLDMWDSLHGTSAAVGFHLYLLAQPPGLPEQLLAAARTPFRPLPRHLDPRPGRPPARDPRRLPLRLGRRHPLDHRRLPRHRRHRRHPRHRRPRRGNTLSTPVTVLQQDWGAALGYDAEALWRAWAPDLRHRTVTCGHFMAEEEPGMVAEEIRGLLAR